ncbi:MAG: hypothetical protein AB7I27_04860 [Bacteriovoracaceae bacterium]
MKLIPLVLLFSITVAQASECNLTPKKLSLIERVLLKKVDEDRLEFQRSRAAQSANEECEARRSINLEISGDLKDFIQKIRKGHPELNNVSDEEIVQVVLMSPN